MSSLRLAQGPRSTRVASRELTSQRGIWSRYWGVAELWGEFFLLTYGLARLVMKVSAHVFCRIHLNFANFNSDICSSLSTFPGKKFW